MPLEILFTIKNTITIIIDASRDINYDYKHNYNHN